MEIGPVEAAGMGRAPIGWPAIRAWQEATRVITRPWEVRLLRRASSAYLSESVEAENPQRAAPWHAPSAVIDQEANERQLRAVLG